MRTEQLALFVCHYPQSGRVDLLRESPYLCIAVDYCYFTQCYGKNSESYLEGPLVTETSLADKLIYHRIETEPQNLGIYNYYNYLQSDEQKNTWQTFKRGKEEYLIFLKQ